MNESEATAKLIKEMNKFYDVFLIKVTASHISNTGIPDILGSIYGESVAIECKAINDSRKPLSINAVLTKKQAWTLRQLKRVRSKVYVGLYFKDLKKWRFIDIDKIKDKMTYKEVVQNSCDIAGLVA